ncbi:HNH endonuclease family protein [Microcoleus sp. herbarium2]|uniref:HNH endonuclease family protein n=1 Tax=Microcoleus sp. herbarium2 TaxID=3055433 RepID=UPI002FD7291A
MSIRSAPAKYKPTSLKEKLRTLINQRASAQEFQAKLEWLEYKESGGGSNKPLKYFWLTAEYYYPWFKKGAVGVPKCLDKSRVYDFASTSIEHIYPQNATIGSSVFDSSLEPLKHSLGNLTILDPGLNEMGDNDAFLTKKPIYKRSSVFLTKDEIGGKAAWTLNEITSHKSLLIDIGMKIFTI